jgi:hypothetical protein
MGETDSKTETREITLKYDGSEWVHHMKQPTQGQAVQIMGLINAKGLNQPGQTAEQQRVAMARAVKHVQVAVALAAGLHEDPEEWDRLTMSMAAGTCTAEVMFDVILGTMQAWDADETEPANRAERRAAARPKARRT